MAAIGFCGPVRAIMISRPGDIRLSGMIVTRLNDEESNPFAAPESDFEPDRLVSRSMPMKFAGFGLRLTAAIVDTVILFIGNVSVSSGLFALGRDAPAMIMLFLALNLAICWLYYAVQESSAAQATIGKQLAAICVVDQYGERISFGTATLRYLVRLVSGLLFFIGYLIQPITRRKQALHDMVAGTLVIKRSFRETRLSTQCAEGGY